METLKKLGNSISLLNRESNDFSCFLKAFRSIAKDPSYNPFRFDYTQQDQIVLKDLESVYFKVVDLLEKNKFSISRLICLRGDGNQDGHALHLENEVVTFIDFKAYLHHLDKKKFDKFSHLLHEMLHASHYSLNKMLCPTALVDGGDTLFAKSLVEGIAVFLAQKLNPQGDNFWFGYLNNELKQKWIKNAEKYYLEDLQALCSGKYSKEQEVNLLSLKDFSDHEIIRGRRSYYVVSKFLKDQNLTPENVMTLSLSKFRVLISKSLSL